MVTLLYYCINYDPYCVALYHCFITLLCLLDKYLTRGRKQCLPLCTTKARRLTLLIIVLFRSLAFLQVTGESDCRSTQRLSLSRGVITSHQHGFIAKRSTTTNLLDSLNDWTLSVENKRIETIVHVDFARAFDTVSHEKLQLKLQACGITGHLLLLISNFWHDCSQVTKVGQHISQRISLTSGVVQGSCLGPLLFLICINDLVSVFNTSVTPELYADDLKLYACLSCSSSCADFQQNLDRLTEWANVWQLTISVKKCCIMRVGNRQTLDDGPMHQFVLCNDTPKYVNVVNDLGVLVDPY